MDDKRRRVDPPESVGSNPGWSITSYLVSGMLVWGGIGWLVDRWVGTSRVFLPVGLILGLAAALYLVYARFGRN